MFQGAWVAQSIKCPALGFGSDHDLIVHEFKPRIGLRADRAEPAKDSLFSSLPPQLFFFLFLFLFLSLSLFLFLSLYLKVNKQTLKKNASHFTSGRAAII